jgi:hypothetical protein
MPMLYPSLKAIVCEVFLIVLQSKHLSTFSLEEILVRTLAVGDVFLLFFSFLLN